MERVTDSAIGQPKLPLPECSAAPGKCGGWERSRPLPSSRSHWRSAHIPRKPRAGGGRFCGSRRRLVQPPPGAGSWRPRANRRDSVPIPEFSHGVQTGKSSGERWAEGGETMAEGGQRCRREGGIRRHCKVD